MIQIESKFNPGDRVYIDGMGTVEFIVHSIVAEIEEPGVFPKKRKDGKGYYFDTSFEIKKQYKLCIRSNGIHSFASRLDIGGTFGEGILRKVEK